MSPARARSRGTTGEQLTRGPPWSSGAAVRFVDRHAGPDSGCRSIQTVQFITAPNQRVEFPESIAAGVAGDTVCSDGVLFDVVGFLERVGSVDELLSVADPVAVGVGD